MCALSHYNFPFVRFWAAWVSIGHLGVSYLHHFTDPWNFATQFYFFRLQLLLRQILLRIQLQNVNCLL